MPDSSPVSSSPVSALPPKPVIRHTLLAALGGFLAISVIAFLANNLHMALILGSFGASCVLVFGFPDAPFSQPRNVVVGHPLSSFVDLLYNRVLRGHAYLKYW